MAKKKAKPKPKKKVKDKSIQLLGDRIEVLRIEKGLSMRKFAEICGISKSQINELKNGGVDFRYTTLLKVANGLNMTVSELLKF